MIDFEPCHPYPVKIGETVTIKKQEWDCVVPCTVVGVTAGAALPVLQTPAGRSSPRMS